MDEELHDTDPRLAKGRDDGNAQPRERAAAQEGAAVEAGFTGTGSSGSQGGRSLYGVSADDQDPRRPLAKDGAREPAPGEADPLAEDAAMGDERESSL